VATEAAWLNGNNFKKETTKRGKNKRKGLTLTGLLMEGLGRDSERFIGTCNDLQEHGRHPKSLQDSLRHRYCVPCCVLRGLNSSYHVLIETRGSDVGSTPFQIFFPVLALIPDDQ